MIADKDQKRLKKLLASYQAADGLAFRGFARYMRTTPSQTATKAYDQYVRQFMRADGYMKEIMAIVDPTPQEPKS